MIQLQEKSGYNTMDNSDYILYERKQYALYTLSNRAIPHITDGLKNGARRILWVAKDGKKHKSATLAGATMPYHPHGDQSICGTINTLASPYGNNIPLLTGEGAFGTILKPTAYGASRYTSVYISEFTKDVILPDIEILPMVENYDSTLDEPKHFLPLLPVVLLNPQEGIAVGFATSILPRSLDDIINAQLDYLNNKEIIEPKPSLKPINQNAISIDEGKWQFNGSFKRKNAYTITITNLPYGLLHEKYIDKLNKLSDNDKIVDYIDNSKNYYEIDVMFKRGTLNGKSDSEILKILHLTSTATENLNVIDFNGDSIINMTFEEIIKTFTEWRLSWFVKRYQRLVDLLNIDIQRYKDILTAIDNNLGSKARSIKSREEMITYCKSINIIYTDYICDLPVYRFTENEKSKIEDKLKNALILLDDYMNIINSDKLQRKIYKQELMQIINNYTKGKYETLY